MAGIATNGATIADSISNGHITYRVYEYQGSVPDGNGGSIPIYGWNTYTTHATVKGTCNASPSSVYINGKNAVLSGDRTTENDQYSIPAGEYVGGAHTGAAGSVTSGNSKNVFIGGKSVSVIGSTVSTHASSASSISSGGSSNVYIGG